MDLARSLITVGNPSFLSWQTIRELGFSRAILDSVVLKALLIRNYLTVRGGNICRHPLFDRQVSDQKRIISYNIGMAFAKLYAEKICDVPQLLHVEFLKKRNAIELHEAPGGARSKEPDLVGMDAVGRWHLFEAKGVSTAETQLGGKIAEAKSQLAQVETIHGSAPETRTACATYIGATRILTRIEDPPEKGDRVIRVSKEKYEEAYYSPFLSWDDPDIGLVRERRNYDGLSVETFLVKKEGHTMILGLDSEIYDRARSGSSGLPDSVHGRYRERAFKGSDSYSVGLDGVFFQFVD
jgi:hypothetical protein